MSELISTASLVVGLPAVALISTAGMLRSALSGRALPGCGPGSSCDEVTTGRWSRLGSIPVTLPGAALYLAMLAGAVLVHPAVSSGLAERAGISLAFCSILAAGAAVWFTALQALVIHRFCKYCLLTHACALAGAILALRAEPPTQNVLIAALALLLLFVLLQVLIEPKLYAIREVEPADTASANAVGDPAPAAEPEPEPASVSSDNPTLSTEPRDASDAPALQQPATVAVAETPAAPRRIYAVGRKISLSQHLWPVLGNPDAQHIIIDQFDYTCHFCRDLHKYLLRVIEQSPDRFAVLMMPVPMEARCNRTVKVTPPEHHNACFYARHALAVFKARPEAFAEFDQWLFEPVQPHPLEDVQVKARLLAGGADALAAALADPWMERRHNEAISIYDAVGQGAIPKLLFASAVVSGPVPSYEELQKILKQVMEIQPRS